jgi:peptidoglycan/LPS O-acetylase OafA/YrhL
MESRRSPSGPSIGASFSPRHNSLNFLRLALALCVVVSHTVTGSWENDLFHRMGFGELAVFGFFGISGYLIASSAEHNKVLRYLWQRFLRIFPAFWACLIVVAVIASMVPLQNFGILTSSVAAASSPSGWILHNWWLRITQPTIDARFWNNPLWTLTYEFLCYLVLAALAVTGLLRRRLAVAILAAGVWGLQILFTFIPSLHHEFVVPASTMNLFLGGHNFWIMWFIKFGVVFLTGTLIYLYRDRVPDSGLLALGCFAALLGSLWLPTSSAGDYWVFASSGLFVALIAYPMIWLGIHLPLQRVGARNDYSYGTYIYAYPAQVLLTIFGVKRWGALPFFLLTVLFTIPFAVASWWFVERHALRLKKIELRAVRTRLSRAVSRTMHRREEVAEAQNIPSAR